MTSCGWLALVSTGRRVRRSAMEEDGVVDSAQVRGWIERFIDFDTPIRKAANIRTIVGPLVK